MASADPYAFTPPLPHLAFYILLVLARGDRHGYGIIAGIADICRVTMVPRTGIIYPLLKRMTAAGLIADAGMQYPDASNRPLKHYSITQRGLITLKADLRRMSHAVSTGKAAGLLAETEIPPDIQMLFVE